MVKDDLMYIVGGSGINRYGDVWTFHFGTNVGTLNGWVEGKEGGLLYHVLYLVFGRGSLLVCFFFCPVGNVIDDIWNIE